MPKNARISRRQRLTLWLNLADLRYGFRCKNCDKLDSNLSLKTTQTIQRRTRQRGNRLVVRYQSRAEPLTTYGGKDEPPYSKIFLCKISSNTTVA